MSIYKKILFCFGAVSIVTGAFVVGDEMFFKEKATEDKLLSYEELKTIPLEIFFQQYHENKIKTQEEYSSKTKLIGVFYNAEESNGGFMVILNPSWESSEILYATLPIKFKKDLIDIKNGRLISITCNKLGQYGISPHFEKCYSIEKVDTGGVKGDIFLDKLVQQSTNQ